MSEDLILILQTGGTIDKEYPKRRGAYAFEIGEPASKRILNRTRPCLNIIHETVYQKDSQDITDTNREELQKACKFSQSNKILITHGTDTMIETAEFLAKSDLSSSKKVLLTGAFKPETLKDSDADFNVGVALGALQCMSRPGVYVVMNGKVYPWNEVTRDTHTGNFISKS